MDKQTRIKALKWASETFRWSKVDGCGGYEIGRPVEETINCPRTLHTGVGKKPIYYLNSHTKPTKKNEQKRKNTTN